MEFHDEEEANKIKHFLDILLNRTDKLDKKYVSNQQDKFQ